MTDAEQANDQPESAAQVEFNAADAIQALLSQKESPVTPEPEDDEQPQPSPETESVVETPEPSAEVEGGVVAKTPEPEAQKPVERKEPAPETAKATESDQQDQLLAQLNSLVPQLQNAIQSEFADIKSFPDLQKLAAEDPARYNRFVIHQAQLQHAQSEQQRLGADAQQRFLNAQVAELKTKFPDYVDPVKGVALRAEFTEFAKARGFSEQRMRTASAADILTLRDAMAWQKYQAEKAKEPARIAAETLKAKEKAAHAPAVQKPGQPEANEKADKAKEKFLKFKSTGHLDDLTSLLIESGIA